MNASRTNPFSTRFTRPGRIAPLDGGGEEVDAAALLVRLAAVGGAAAIIGPHGSGKTTLLGHLADAIEATGVTVMRVRSRGRWGATNVLFALVRAGRAATVCVDSWECLGPVARNTLPIVARMLGCGLLVTMHLQSRLPVLARCRTTAALLERICMTLPGHDAWYGTVITPDDVEAAFARHRGDIRESLYELYDTFELRSRTVEMRRS